MSVVNRSNALVTVLGVGAAALAVLATRTPAPPAGTIPVVATQASTSPSAPAPTPSPSGPSSVLYPLARFSPPPVGARFLFLGGRITHGFFASSSDTAYPAVVSNALRQDFSLKSVQLHLGNATSAGFTSAVSPDQALVVVEVGTSEDTPLRTFVPRYAQLVQRARATWKNAALICLGIWGGAGNPYDTDIARSCHRAGGTFVGIADLYERNALRGPVGTQTSAGTRDNFHPNDDGHAAIADRIIQVLARKPLAALTPSPAR